jgi:hypothetical protein
VNTTGYIFNRQVGVLTPTAGKRNIAQTTGDITMKNLTIITAVTLSAAILAGCATQSEKACPPRQLQQNPLQHR